MEAAELKGLMHVLRHARRGFWRVALVVALSKVAFWLACSQVLNQRAVDTADTWVDPVWTFTGNRSLRRVFASLRHSSMLLPRS